MAEPLFYSNNADLKYPLSDFHNEPVPNSILLNLTLGIPEGYEPAVAAIRVQSTFVFISIEDKNTREPIATSLITRPRLATVYPLDMDIDGYGWVSYGPGAINEEYFSGDILIDVDPECITALKSTAPPFSVEVNGIASEVSNILDFLSANDNLLITVDNGIMYIDRNDSAITIDERANLTASVSALSVTTSDLVLSIGGVQPDETGNVNIDIDECIEGCSGTREISIPRGDTGQGESIELPLDVFQPRVFDEDDPCGENEVESSSAGEDDPFDVCNEVEKVDIKDPGNDASVGTLYTLKDYTGAE
jgi:hypothetical protein